MQGRFEILSLAGSFTTAENGGMKTRTGGLSVSLAGPDGRVIGGEVTGLLLAASPIQVGLLSVPRFLYTKHFLFNVYCPSTVCYSLLKYNKFLYGERGFMSSLQFFLTRIG